VRRGDRQSQRASDGGSAQHAAKWGHCLIL
jgi:hypothetical protein